MAQQQPQRRGRTTHRPTTHRRTTRHIILDAQGHTITRFALSGCAGRPPFCRCKYDRVTTALLWLGRRTPARASSQQNATAAPRPEPAISIKRSMKAEHLVCLGCGKHFSMLKRHLRRDHQNDDERLSWGYHPRIRWLPRKEPSGFARKTELGRKGWPATKEARVLKIRRIRSPRLPSLLGQNGRSEGFHRSDPTH